MKSIKIFCRLLAIAFLLLPVAAKAEGLYVVGAVGPAAQEAFTNAFLNNFREEPEEPDSGTGFMLGFGKELGDTFAVELFYTSSGTAEITYLDEKVEDSEVTTFGAALKWRYDLSDVTKGYIKLGAHSWERDVAVTTPSNEDSDFYDEDLVPEVDGTGTVLGAGVEYQFTDTIAFVLGYDYYALDQTNLTHTNIGVKYSF